MRKGRGRFPAFSFILVAMLATADRLAFFRELETSLHRRATRNSPVAVSALLEDDFVEFGKSGRTYDMRATVELLHGDDSDLVPEVRDFRIRPLAPTIVLVTYRSGRGDVFALRSSIWRLSEGKWRMTFHQGTDAAR
jgi:hypothetical protein